MSAPELRHFEVFVNTHTSSITVEAADAEEAAELGSELLAEMLANDARRDNLSVTPVPPVVWRDRHLDTDHSRRA